MSRIPLTPWQRFLSVYSRGCGSELCDKANKVCLARGKVPCDILFIGEAPGESENVLGQPFVGPAGQLLDRIVTDAISTDPIRCAFTNLVGCIPRGETTRKTEAPADEDVKCCSDRLVDFILLCKPRVIVCVGAVARDWLDPKRKPHIDLPLIDGKPIPTIDITHPAAILRANVAQRGLSIQRCVTRIENAIDDFVFYCGRQGQLPFPD